MVTGKWLGLGRADGIGRMTTSRGEEGTAGWEERGKIGRDRPSILVTYTRLILESTSQRAREVSQGWPSGRGFTLMRVETWKLQIVHLHHTLEMCLIKKKIV